MRRFRIRFQSKEDESRAWFEVAKRGRITCLENDEFIVPEPALAFLDELGAGYTVLFEEESQDPSDPVRDFAAATV